MTEHKYFTLDVFRDRIFGGNPLAMFSDASGFNDAQMQAVARELNLSETVFVLPPDDPAHTRRLRIFTPATQLGPAIANLLAYREKSHDDSSYRCKRTHP